MRRDIRNPASRNNHRRALGYLDHVVRLLERYQCRIMGEVLIKQPGETYNPAATYPNAVAELAATFDHQAADAGQRGWMMLDARTKVKNEGSVHAVTTRRYRRGGNTYPQLVESPVFGHSDTHVLLQLADIVASALVYPCACTAYHQPVVGDPHLDPSLQVVRATFGDRLNRLQHLYTDDAGNLRGGFRVIDRLGHQPARLLFRDTPQA